MSKTQCLVGLVAAAVAIAPACAPAPGGMAAGPKVAPVKAGAARGPAQGPDVGAGAGTLEAVRRQLEGKWQLASLEVAEASGTRTAVPATGSMVYDAYGNFTLAIEVAPAAARAFGLEAAALDLSGRAVIDTQHQSLRVVGLETEGETPRAENLRRTRDYGFEGTTLVLSARDAAGHVTSVTRWTRQP